MKMTIHRALAELKTLGARIEKGVAGLKVLGFAQKDKDVVIPGTDRMGAASTQQKAEDFKKNAEADYNSVMALIARRTNIKSLIVASNAVTMVKIGTKDMTIAQAITEKAFIVEKKALLTRLEHQRTITAGAINKMNEEVATRLQKNIEVMLGKEPKPSQVAELTESFNDLNQWKLVDPLELNEKIKALSDEISAFETNVDAVLSESNAVTIIEVAD